MSHNITMPALSPTMEEGTLAKWLVKEGDAVAAGDVIAEIETDKATMEVEAVDDGTVGKLVVAEGTEGVAVNAVIAVLLEEGESAGDLPASFEVPAAGAAAPRDEGGGKAPAPKKAEAEATAETKPAEPVAAAAEAPEAVPAPAPAPAKPNGEAAAPREAGARIFASPLARRLAAENAIELAAVAGTGPHGRIIKRDIEAALEGGQPAARAPAEAPAPTAAPKAAPAAAPGTLRAQVEALYAPGSYEAVPNDGMRRIVAERLTEAKQTIPHFYLTIDCRIDAMMAARAEINATAPKGEDGAPEYKLTVNDFVIKAWAVALQNVPKANATWAGDAILYHAHSDIGVAVAIEGGLFTPIVRQAELKSLRQISAEMKDFAARARKRHLAPEEYQGGSSAVSNLGMFGIREFAAVINPPHGTLIAIGAGEERVYADAGAVRTGTFMTATLSCDHRSVDGALGAQALAEFRRLIENPVAMLA